MPRSITTIAIILSAALSTAMAASEAWTSDYEAARKKAAAENKDLLIDFTGSDWCAWCIKLRKEVFDLPAFEAGVKDKFVLVELDYPNDKTRVTEAVAKQNEELLKKYPIKGYPTILLCDASGKPFAATGYQPGGPEAYLKALDELSANKTARDKGLADASGKEGADKARQLIATLDDLKLDFGMTHSWYEDVAGEIKKADPADETGFAKNEASELKFASFMTKLGEFRSKADLEGAMKLAEETLADKSLSIEFRHQVHGHQAATLAYAGKKDEAIAVLRKAIAEEPPGPRTEELVKFIEILEKEKAAKPPVAPETKSE